MSTTTQNDTQARIEEWRSMLASGRIVAVQTNRSEGEGWTHFHNHREDVPGVLPALFAEIDRLAAALAATERKLEFQRIATGHILDAAGAAFALARARGES
jgi:hypothetical protein